MRRGPPLSGQHREGRVRLIVYISHHGGQVVHASLCMSLLAWWAGSTRLVVNLPTMVAGSTRLVVPILSMVAGSTRLGVCLSHHGG